jgi:hypothetical protein
MAFDNLPGIFENVLDGNLTIIPVNDNPIMMVIGTASQGDSETVYRVDRISDAARTYAKDGTLVRGMYEVSVAGGLNLRLFRIGATAASLVGIGKGTGSGLTIETVRKDDSAGTDYELFYEDSTGRLRVYRASDDELVYDNNPSYPLEKVDLGEVVVSGTAQAGTEDDLGSLSTPISLEDADEAHAGGAYPVYTAGTDGINLSRMEMYEALHNAYALLEDQEIDVVVPMNVYLDDLNVMDLTPAQITSRGLASVSDYPSAGTDEDVLGKMYMEEYEGRNYFWWWFPADPTSPSFSAAQIYPSAGSASATTKTDGTSLTADDFHEVNFAYQLANFCYTQCRDNTEMTGVIGVLPPASYSLKDVSQWVGTLPTTEEDANGNVIISSGGNGTGLLGNKFMCGRQAVTSSLTAFTIDGIAGLYNGGLIATDDGWLDGTHIKDDNDHLIDIGKYVSVVASYPILANPSRANSYAATGAPTYGGFYTTLPANSAPTNKPLRNIRLPFRINKAKLDQMAGQRYVTFHAKPRGIVVSDAPTAARPDSDYQRLSTVRQVKACVDAVREAGEPFLGEGMTGALIAALDTAIDSALKALVKLGVIVRYDHQVIVTQQQRVLGQATIELKIVPAFELRQITVVVALAAV